MTTTVHVSVYPSYLLRLSNAELARDYPEHASDLSAFREQLAADAEAGIVYPVGEPCEGWDQHMGCPGHRAEPARKPKDVSLAEFLRFCMEGFELPWWQKMMHEHLEAGGDLRILLERSQLRRPPPPLVPGVRYLCTREALAGYRARAEEAGLGLTVVPVKRHGATSTAPAPVQFEVGPKVGKDGER
jgi:hypothetical protein